MWLHGIAFKSSGGISSRQIEQVDGALDEAFRFTLALGAAAATSMLAEREARAACTPRMTWTHAANRKTSTWLNRSSGIAPGASGGEAYVYDPNLQGKSSKDTFAKVTTLEACSPEAERLKERIITHHGYTGSKQAERILKDWENAITNFRYINFKTQAANDKRPAAAPALVNA